VTGTGFTDAATWYASLPVLYAAAAALITHPAGQVLLIKPPFIAPRIPAALTARATGGAVYLPSTI
jgi:hypothetical protein